MALPQPQKIAAQQKPAAPRQVAAESGKEAAHPPQVDGFKLKGKLTGSLKDITNLLRSISFLEVAPEKDMVNVIYVESRDINKSPYLFSIVKMKEDEVEVVYSIPPEIGPKKRRVDVASYLLNILSLVESAYEVDNKTLYQLVENSITDLAGSVTMDYSKLYTAYDSLKKEVDDYRKKVDRLNDQTQALTTKNYELKTQNDDLRLRVQELEALSDDALRAKLQEWISEHNGSIVVPEFTRLYKVSDARVEEMLNKLVSEGYLEVMQ
jgi:regulator of replication initiation timing